MDDLGESFYKLSQLARTIWPELNNINIADYCSQNHLPGPDQDPWYTGFVIDYAVDGVRVDYACIGAVPSPSDALVALDNKHVSIFFKPEVDASLETRNPAQNIWAGGQRLAPGSRITFGMTEFVDIMDHILLRMLMHKCGMLTEQHVLYDIDSESSLMKTARVYLGMSCMQYEALRYRLQQIVAAV